MKTIQLYTYKYTPEQTKKDWRVITSPLIPVLLNFKGDAMLIMRGGDQQQTNVHVSKKSVSMLFSEVYVFSVL